VGAGFFVIGGAGAAFVVDGAGAGAAVVDGVDGDPGDEVGGSERGFTKK
jgi:hypothetical protein